MIVKTVLIVDDNPADLFLLEAIITKMRPEYNVIKANDGQEALEILQESGGEVDLILLDINMPRMNGPEFLDAYSEKYDREIPVVIMLTSSNFDIDKERTLSYKCVKDYIVKPFKGEYIERLEKIFSETKSAEVQSQA